MRTGAKADPEYQEVTVLLPIAGFTGDTKGISRSNASYTFDSLARKVLPYSQSEVKEYKAKTESDIKVVFNVFKEVDHDVYKRLLGRD